MGERAPHIGPGLLKVARATHLLPRGTGGGSHPADHGE